MNPLGVLQGMLTLIAATFLGVLVANILISLGYIEKVGFLLVPVMRAAGLPKQLSFPAVVGIINGRAEHSIVSSYMRQSRIGEAEVLAYNLVTTPLAVIFYLYRYYLPIYIASLGLIVGGIYVLLSFISSLVAFTLGVIYGRLKVRSKDMLAEGYSERLKGRGFRDCLRMAVSTTIYITKRYIVITIVLLVLDNIGIFSQMKLLLKAARIPVSPQGLAIVTTQVASPTAGVLMAGELLKSSSITAKEALIALILGRFLFLISQDYPRASFPFYASMYPVSTATKLVLFSALATFISTPLCILLVNILL
ncbi:MAG: hypothetical protein ACP5JF_03610 [Candidatus Methanodesulfokora sp.]